jgi:acetolactate synthase small subunit
MHRRGGFPGDRKAVSRMLLLPSGVAPATVTRLSVDVADRPGVLLRVLGICQRRGARVVAMTYGPAGAAEISRIELALSADDRHLNLLRGRLEASIDVLGVSYAAS